MFLGFKERIPRKASFFFSKFSLTKSTQGVLNVEKIVLSLPLPCTHSITISLCEREREREVKEREIVREREREMQEGGRENKGD